MRQVLCWIGIHKPMPTTKDGEQRTVQVCYRCLNQRIWQEGMWSKWHEPDFDVSSRSIWIHQHRSWWERDR